MDELELTIGDRVVLSAEGRKIYSLQVADRRRHGGKILSRSQKISDCWRVKWDGLTIPVVLHKDFIEREL